MVDIYVGIYYVQKRTKIESLIITNFPKRFTGRGLGRFKVIMRIRTWRLIYTFNKVSSKKVRIKTIYIKQLM